MTRKEANLEIIRKLKHYITMNPDMRLGQALRNVGIIVDTMNKETGEVVWANHFNEEPVQMLERMKQRKKEIV